MEAAQVVESSVDVLITRGHRSGYVNILVRRPGQNDEVVTCHPDNREKLSRFAQKVGLPLDRVLDAIKRSLQLETAAQAGEDTRAAGGPITFAVTLRGLNEPRAQGRAFTAEPPLEALRQALAVTGYHAPEPVVEWQCAELLAALDVDFHHLALQDRPDPHLLEVLCRRVRPHPALWWVTHGRGLRFIYAARHGLTAAELAACAAVGVRSLRPDATCEVKRETRHPGYSRPGYPAAGPFHAETPTEDLGALAACLCREPDTAAVDDWLAERGLQRDQAYNHSHCPVDPATPSHGTPVFVGDGGVRCHKCEGSGLTLGRAKAGFFPWAGLVGGGLPTRLRSAAQGFCHWEHAQYVVAEDLGLTGSLARDCYSALLKAIHGPRDPRVSQVMTAGRGLVRMEAGWTTADLGQYHRREGLAVRLGCLPAVQQVAWDKDDTTVVTVNGERHGIFQGVDDLGPYGYPAVTPVRGIQLAYYWRTNDDPSRVFALVLPEYLRAEDKAAYRPRYVPLPRRMSMAQAEAVISRSFPGVDFRYLRLLMAARGCVEAGVGQPPRIATDGPSGAGKDATIALAAGMLGDGAAKVGWSKDPQEFRRTLHSEGIRHSFVSCDEIVKSIRAARVDILAGLAPFLTFESGVSVRLLYVGSVTARTVPVVVLTDTHFPHEMHSDEQLGRRFVYVHLTRRVDWQRSAQEGIDRWRAQALDHAEAANALLSDVIDHYFTGNEPWVFEDIAKDLGFDLLHRSGHMGQDPRDDLRRLFRACCDHRAVQACQTTWKGRGWCAVSREAQDPVSEAWRAVCDELNTGFTSSRRVKETDWAALLGVTEPVEADVSPRGAKLAVRFRCGDPRSPSVRYNREILPPDQSPPEPRDGPGELPQGPGPTAPPKPPAAPGEESLPIGKGPGPADPSVEKADQLHEQGVPAVGGGGHQDVLGGRPAHGDGGSQATQALEKQPTFIDLETRSACNLRTEGGHRYAADATTELLTVVASLGDHVVVWTPTLDAPLSVSGLWPLEFGEPQTVETFAGPMLPAPLADAITAGRPFCAHNADNFDRLVWEAKRLPAPSAWLDTLPEARAAGRPGRAGGAPARPG